MTRAAYVKATVIATLGATIAIAIPTTTKLVWNITPSVPIGLYSIAPSHRLEVTDIVAIMPPEPLAGFMVRRGYIGPGVPLLKRVMALPGQRVCRIGAAITVDDVPLGDARDRDRIGRELPIWQGCRQLAAGELFLMNPDAGDSLDGRYFGPLADTTVIGRATPVWTDEDGDGRFVWRAPTR
ncbi:MAG: S26 family signal peptidase [Alphaproteobacteria bacterium]|nr:S26 family signal peptidase [Alphaproteobacteria bacterium]